MCMSFPTRERGLKCYCHAHRKQTHDVVPHAGTWIEIENAELRDENAALVVPHAGTWIEIVKGKNPKAITARRSPRGNVD